MTERDDLDPVRRAVGDLLREPVSGGERLSYRGGTFLVARLYRADGTPVVAKWTEVPNGPLVAERASLRALETTAVRDRVPVVIAATEDATLLVMTDLGITDDERLGVLLEGDDPEIAEAGLLAHVEALAALHVATAGAPVRALAANLAAAEPYTRSRHAINHVNDLVELLPERLAAVLGRDVRISDELGQVRNAIRSPGPLLALSHGDGTAANSFIRDGRAVLLDFETGAARHALLDGTFARQRYLFSVWAKAFPEDVRRRGMAVYRDRLLAGVPGVTRDDYDAGEAAACAAWTAITLGRFAEVRDHDVRFGRTGWRARIVTALDHLCEVSEETGCTPAIGRAARAAAGVLRGKWPDAETHLPLHAAWAGRPT